MPRISINAIECVQNNKSFIITSMNSSILKKMCFVSRKKDDAIKGFQRLLNVKRAKDIALYLDNLKGIIPSAIIVSAQDNTKMRFDKQSSKLSFETSQDGLLVIDGQHRLFGLIEAKGEYDMPVVIFNNLKSSEEVKLFIDINTTQKGVPTALILDIKNQAGTETKLEERQRELFEKLNTDSVLAGYLLKNESKAGKISRTVFNNSTKSIFTNSPVSEMGDDIIYKTVKNYLEAVDVIFKESRNKDARLNKTILFKSVMNLFNEVCEKCLIKYKNLKVESFIDYIGSIRDLNFNEYTGTNKATENRIVNDMRSLLREPLQVGEDMF
ncbi:MAG: DGQHR domain-containing protein [Sedimentibacter saalensis]|uniref:DGQHR domain-containing protein n=1 Tax=Sedimentibacter saalensis TaxID=130788 RepID=UPI0031597959